MISFRHVSKSFGDKRVLRDVSFDVQDGEVFFIIGASGVGKSVLIKHLVGLLHPDSGEIWLDGQEVSRLGERKMYPVRKRCAMVFQHATLFDSLTCAENVGLPLRKHRKLRPAEVASEALRLLTQVHMEEFAERYPAELGDGLRKRVAIARALALEPRTVLFDEPTTSLDPVNARRVDQLIRELSDRLGVTSIVVSHDLPSIFGIADRIVMLYKGEVRLLGRPDDFRSTQDAIIEQFVNGRAEGPMEA
jgi:phospholipid/cholesterol/gamma-HCH transport system ATP-binding protein